MVHRELLRQNLEVAGRTGTSMELWAAGDPEHPELAALAAEFAMPVHAQDAGNLGDRMGAALSSGLERANMVLLIGSDCVTLEPDHFEQAFDALATGADLVLGPSEDGGYYLIGARRIDATVFEGVGWGGEQAFAQTHHNAKACGYALAVIATGWDVDTQEDYQRAVKEGLMGGMD